jgi:hypothetical protein
VDKFGIGFSYENRFGLSELGLKTLNMALPAKWGTFGLTVQQFGFSNYNENKFGLAYGMMVSKVLFLRTKLVLPLKLGSKQKSQTSLLWVLIFLMCPTQN